jgi:hypothetical protein
MFAIALLPACNAPAANEHLRTEYVDACVTYTNDIAHYSRNWSPEQFLPHDNPNALCNCLFDKLQTKFDQEQIRYFINLHLAWNHDAAAKKRADQIANAQNAKDPDWALQSLESVMSMDDEVAYCEKSTRTKPSLIGADTFFNF